MTKIIARKTIAKKEILVLVCERPSWWNKSSKLILVIFVRRLSFLLVNIAFHVVAFTLDGAFENIGINFRLFFIFLL
jgi:hypothetical protein